MIYFPYVHRYYEDFEKLWIGTYFNSTKNKYINVIYLNFNDVVYEVNNDDLYDSLMAKSDLRSSTRYAVIVGGLEAY